MALIRRYFARRDTLSSDRRQQLASTIAQRLAVKVALAEPATNPEELLATILHQKRAASSEALPFGFMESFTLRPLGIPEIIDAAIRIIRRRTRPLVTIAAVVLVPIAIVQYFISRSLQATASGLQTISPPPTLTRCLSR